MLPAASTSFLPVAILREAKTPLGLLELRQRWSLALERPIFEILLQGDLMMSDAIHLSEDALAEHTLAELLDDHLRVLVGGLGLGFTTLRALANPRVASVVVVERLQPVIDWHREKLFPWSAEMLVDGRIELLEDDFFDYLARPATPNSTFDAILIDIDDNPECVWHSGHADFYTLAGLMSAAHHLRPGGVLAFWFATRPAETFLTEVGQVLRNSRVEAVRFTNPSLHHEEENFLVLGRCPI